MLTPARSATRLVVTATRPPSSRTRAAALQMTSTVSRERAWRGVFRGSTWGFRRGGIAFGRALRNPSSTQVRRRQRSTAEPTRRLTMHGQGAIAALLLAAVPAHLGGNWDFSVEL